MAPDYLAIDYAIFQAAMAGCETIWVVANYDAVPLVRKRIGDYIHDPATIGNKKLSMAPDKYRKFASIYYIPIPGEEQHKSFCLPWAITKGATVANHISGQVSKWTIPNKFYVSFPYGVFDPNEIRESRFDISSNKNFMITKDGKSARDNLHLPFTFDQQDLTRFVHNFKTLENNLSIHLDNQQEHFTNNVKLDKLFENKEPEEEVLFEPSWFHQIDSWASYRDYLADQNTAKVRSPGKIYIHYSQWAPIGVDSDEHME